MREGGLLGLIRRLKGAARAGAAGGLSDAELLSRWVAGRDEAAFELLLWRHGPMVLGLCRRLLAHEADAEDAFQATFLALVRHGSAVGKREAVGAWLYKVAYRVALRLRAGAARRPTFDPRAMDLPAPQTAGRADDFRTVLDEEVGRLPARYRAPFVLCHLEGRSGEEAARELGCPVGTVHSRLSRARRRLRDRLARRGIALSAGALAAGGAVPAALVGSTIRLVRPFAAGEAGVVPVRLAALAEGATKTMSAKLRSGLACLLLLTMIAGAVALAPPGGTKEPDKKEEKAAEKAPAFRRISLTADDLAAAMGLNVYKYRVEADKGQRLELYFREFPAEGEAPKYIHRFLFEKTEAGPATLLLSFRSVDGKLSGLSHNDKELFLTVSFTGCSPGWIGTVVRNPLAGLPADGKTLCSPRSDRDGSVRAEKGAQRLLIVYVSKRPDSDPAKSYPRAELVLISPWQE